MASTTKTTAAPTLNSFPVATATINLDIDGHDVNSSMWNYGSTFICNPTTVTDVQITDAFNRVAEDFRLSNKDSLGLYNSNSKFNDTINKYGTAKQNSPEYAKLMKADDDNGAFRIIPISTELSDITWKNNGNVTAYKVDYSGASRYFPSSVEGQAFMRQLNNNYLNNIIPNPGNVTGHYTTCSLQRLIDYGQLITSAW